MSNYVNNRGGDMIDAEFTTLFKELVLSKDSLLDAKRLDQSEDGVMKAQYDEAAALLQQFRAFQGDVVDRFENTEYGLKVLAYLLTLQAFLEVRELQLDGAKVATADLVLLTAIHDAEKELIKIIHDIA